MWSCIGKIAWALSQILILPDWRRWISDYSQSLRWKLEHASANEKVPKLTSFCEHSCKIGNYLKISVKGIVCFSLFVYLFVCFCSWVKKSNVGDVILITTMITFWCCHFYLMDILLNGQCLTSHFFSEYI